MSANSSVSPAGVALPVWRDPAAWMKMADICAVLIALSLPWSTSLVAIFAVALLVTVVPTLDVSRFLESLKRPASALPIALVALALLGTLWSDASWGARFYAVGPTAKLLVLPVLLYHFERSTRGMWVLKAFLISCALLMVMSWLVLIYPGLSLKPVPTINERGIFVKNYIDQSQEFALCAVALVYPVISLWREKRIWPALLLATLAIGFTVNMAFVIVSRTALVTVPIMLAVFAMFHLKWKTNILILSAAIILAGLTWLSSPQLQKTIQSFSSDYRLYKEQNYPTSMGLRLEYWQKSLRFYTEAPVVGHGTGSTKGLFERVATGPSDRAGAFVIDNPHNQTLNVAVQWGTVGVVILFAMWLAHLLLFRGEGLVTWIGFLVVVQNIFTSLFNSHLFDFHEGWMYVLGVGVAGGMVLQARSGAAGKIAMAPGDPVRP